jgi:hypothetical protein
MPAYHNFQGLAEYRDIERANDPESARQVVRSGSRLKLIEKPQSLLGE